MHLILKATQEKFDCQVEKITIQDLPKLTKRNGWVFDWKKEYEKAENSVHKVVTLKYDNVAGILFAFACKESFRLNFDGSTQFLNLKLR
jgi:hypothetical protein